uniref:NADH dehydrogenase subunit 4L n=1 Tax=Parapolybia flava TaxID=2592909 RepID=A0A514CQQ7_9HYME|nr:NADH dehydrogenase subunit 4L [Parapolybia flava]
MLNLWIYIFCLFNLSLLMIVKFYNHALKILLCIEFIVITLLLNIYMIMYFNDYYLLIFMTMFVMEGVLGISLIIMMIRYKGNENLNNLSMILW